MVEELLEKDKLLLDTPFMRQLRQEGMLLALRRDTLNALTLRFDPPVSAYQRVERALNTITDPAELERLHAAAIQCETVADFERALPQPD